MVNSVNQLICHEHKVAPGECFELHHPDRRKGRGITTEELAEQIRQLHLTPEHKPGDGCKEAREKEKAEQAAAMKNSLTNRVAIGPDAVRGPDAPRRTDSGELL